MRVEVNVRMEHTQSEKNATYNACDVRMEDRQGRGSAAAEQGKKYSRW